MFPNKLISVLTDAIKNKEQILIKGEPGIGKTEIIKQVAKNLDADLIVSHPAVSDPTDYKGLPVREASGDHATFLPFGETWRAIQATKLTVWFVDDLGQASESVQKALMQLLLGRRLNGHMLSDDVVFVGATNDVGQKSGVSGLIEPVKSRWTSIVKLDVSLDDWCQWALDNNMPVELIAYLRTNSKALSDFQPTRELTNSACPRTWSYVGKMLNRNVIDHELYSGAVSAGHATEFLAFLDLAKNAPSLDAIIMNPKTEKVPKEPSLMYLVSAGLAMRADKKNFSRIFTYLERMPQAFRVLCMRDAVQKNNQLSATDTFLAWMYKEGKEMI
jgi:hypothetical protein